MDSVRRLQEEKKDWERRASEGNEKLHDALLRLRQAKEELGKKEHKLKKIKDHFEDFKGRLLKESETPFEKLLKAVSTITVGVWVNEIARDGAERSRSGQGRGQQIQREREREREGGNRVVDSQRFASAICSCPCTASETMPRHSPPI